MPLALAKNERYINTLFWLTVSMLAYPHQIHAATRPLYRGMIDKVAGLESRLGELEGQEDNWAYETDQLEQASFWIKYNYLLVD